MLGATEPQLMQQRMVAEGVALAVDGALHAATRQSAQGADRQQLSVGMGAGNGLGDRMVGATS